MTLEEARKIVAEYQKWRMSAPPYNNIIGDFEHEEKANEAIDTLLTATTVTDEMVDRSAKALYLRQKNQTGISTETRIQAELCLQAALGGGELHCHNGGCLRGSDMSITLTLPKNTGGE